MFDCVSPLDAQMAVKACLSGSVSWQSGRRSLLGWDIRFFSLVVKRLFCCFLSFASLYRLSRCYFIIIIIIIIIIS